MTKKNRIASYVLFGILAEVHTPIWLKNNAQLYRGMGLNVYKKRRDLGGGVFLRMTGQH